MNTRFTQTSEQPSPFLYARLVGPGWLELPASVQNLHQISAPGHGHFEVRHGSPVTALLARWLDLPARTPSVDVTLTIERHGQTEKWIRRFGSETITTTQWNDGDHLLWERFGMIELAFKLKIENGNLIYNQRRAALRFDRYSLRLPLWLAPHVTAVEKASSDSDAVQVSVEVTLPAVGLLIAYRGVVHFRTEALQ